MSVIGFWDRDMSEKSALFERKSTLFGFDLPLFSLSYPLCCFFSDPYSELTPFIMFKRFSLIGSKKNKNAVASSLPQLSKAVSSKNSSENLVQEGITFHECGQLEKATSLFQTASDQGDLLGMFFYGISLRHGWGCKKNEQAAFQYLQKAAEHAVENLTNIANTVSQSASKGELVMAIYELGVSFKHGWGCKKNKESAAYFFKVAADLGDADAQNDVAHCYNEGVGVKRDVFLAAKYYRKADKQGQGIMGNSWIWKSKYD
ncbi:hypothetical protein BY458DRAFT_494840 [Sporodiniella umbellata]|nr:hypothetical protein BY458DRAFT_494840 [Sporodiniella umbellata]